MSKQIICVIFICTLIFGSNAFSIKKKMNQDASPLCYAPNVYRTTEDVQQYPTCNVMKVADYFADNFDDAEISKICLHKYEFMDKNAKPYPIIEQCKRRNRFSDTFNYQNQALTTSDGDDYLNSAKLTGKLVEKDGEYIYQTHLNDSNGYIVMTTAPIGNTDDIANDSKLNAVCGGNFFNKLPDKDCFSGNVKVDGKYAKDNTILSFYRNLKANNISIVVMLTNFVEKVNNNVNCNCKVKADKYFAFNDDEDFSIKLPDHETSSGYLVNSKKIKFDENWTEEETRKLEEVIEMRELTFKDEENTPIHKVTHFHFKGWPDFGVPEGEKKEVLFELIDYVRGKMDQGENAIVHCTGGIGRTGTFISSILSSGLKRDAKFNLFKLITEVRKQRPEAVETDKQIGLIRENMKRTAL